MFCNNILLLHVALSKSHPRSFFMSGLVSNLLDHVPLSVKKMLRHIHYVYFHLQSTYVFLYCVPHKINTPNFKTKCKRNNPLYTNWNLFIQYLKFSNIFSFHIFFAMIKSAVINILKKNFGLYLRNIASEKKEI